MEDAGHADSEEIVCSRRGRDNGRDYSETGPPKTINGSVYIDLKELRMLDTSASADFDDEIADSKEVAPEKGLTRAKQKTWKPRIRKEWR